jgi:hypothetical protein
MVVRRVFADAEHLGDLPVGVASRHEVEDHPLTIGEKVIGLHAVPIAVRASWLPPSVGPQGSRLRG